MQAFEVVYVNVHVLPGLKHNALCTVQHAGYEQSDARPEPMYYGPRLCKEARNKKQNITIGNLWKVTR